MLKSGHSHNSHIVKTVHNSGDKYILVKLEAKIIFRRKGQKNPTSDFFLHAKT